ncbi:MAG: hypothetical protein ACI9EF_002278, partial [Pseudohongiellaceae bacterium]
DEATLCALTKASIDGAFLSAERARELHQLLDQRS